MSFDRIFIQGSLSDGLSSANKDAPAILNRSPVQEPMIRSAVVLLAPCRASIAEMPTEVNPSSEPELVMLRSRETPWSCRYAMELGPFCMLNVFHEHMLPSREEDKMLLSVLFSMLASRTNVGAVTILSPRLSTVLISTLYAGLWWHFEMSCPTPETFNG